jgi:hypothetical protein
MDLSFADFILKKFSNFLDPFSLTEISTERLCYPISYATEDFIKGMHTAYKEKVDEDDLLIRQSLLKDFPELEKDFIRNSYITDGAAYLLKGQTVQPTIQLIGMPKIGKTSLLKKIALLAAQDLKKNPSSPVPLLINSEVILHSQVSTKMEFIESCFSQYEEFEAYLREKFFEGKIILLLDELDKIVSLKIKIIEWVQALKTIFSIPLCVLSSRYSGYLEIENASLVIMDIFPIKIQISMAQYMLSEFQFERFVEIITSSNNHFSEFASTPYLFSLLVEMFRWGIVGIDYKISRGKLYSLALKYLLADYDISRYWQGLEFLAADLLIRENKVFNLSNIKNLDLEDIWYSVKNLDLFISQEDLTKISSQKTSEIEIQSFEFDHGIGEIKETPAVELIRATMRKDTTPKWVSNSKENYIAYQIARNCIEKDIFNSFCSEGFRFIHLRFIEILAAQYYLNQVEDSLLHGASGFLMESSTFQKAFNSSFPNNFLFSRRYREVLLFFSSICTENVFENLIKYLLNKETLEHNCIAEKLLKERGYQPNHRPLVNKLKQDKLELSKKNFIKSIFHPVEIIQKMSRQEVIESGLSEHEISFIIEKHTDSTLKSIHWLYLKQLKCFNQTNIKMIKSIFIKLQDVSIQFLSSGSRPSISKVILHKVLLSKFLSIFDKRSPMSLNQSFNKRSASVNFDNDKVMEENTIRISFDRIKIPRNELKIIEKLGNTQKLVAVLEEISQTCPGLDLNLTVKVLLLLGCSITRIHTALANRFRSFQDTYEKLVLLKTLRGLGFVTQHTIDIPLICLSDTKELRAISKNILMMLNAEKLKKHAMNILVKDDSTSFDLLLALRAIRFIKKQKLDEELLFFLVQFIDHYCLELRLEAVISLYSLLKSGEAIEDREIFKILAATPHVLRDRLKLQKYDQNLRIASLKCLVVLWISLDKGKEDTLISSMHHILVKEQISSSFIVGSLVIIVNLLKEFLNKSQEERETVWKCLYKVNAFEYMDLGDINYFMGEIKNVLVKGEKKEIKMVLKILELISVAHIEKNSFLSLILNIELESDLDMIRAISNLLLKWNEILALKSLLNFSVSFNPNLGKLMSKVNCIIKALEKYVNFEESTCLAEYKHLVNWYKSLINQLTENMQWPSKVFPHCTHLLDISADPSFFREEPLAEISGVLVDMDSSCLKFSIDSANSDQDEQPPDIDLCYQFIYAGVRSDGLKYWILWYLKHSNSIQQLIKAAKSWKILFGNKEFGNSQVETLLLKYLQEFPEEIIKITLKINFKSDSFCLRLIDCMIQGKIKTTKAYKSLSNCMELNTSTPLEEIYKMLWISVGDTSYLIYLNNCVNKVMKSVVINSDIQLNSTIKALSSTGCSLLMKPIWEYAITQVKQKSYYLLPTYALGALENSASWDCKFLLSKFRILGLIPVDQLQKDCGSSMSTKKL